MFSAEAATADGFDRTGTRSELALQNSSVRKSSQRRANLELHFGPRKNEGIAEVAERFAVPVKPGNAGGGKGPQFKTDATSSEGPGDWATYQLRTAFRNCRRRSTRKRRLNPAIASLALSGHYVLESGCNYPCQTENVSATGILLRGFPGGDLGEWVVAYLSELGRLEGTIVRSEDTCFAFEIAATPGLRY